MLPKDIIDFSCAQMQGGKPITDVLQEEAVGYGLEDEEGEEDAGGDELRRALQLSR